jgi:hypothetical protein
MLILKDSLSANPAPNLSLHVEGISMLPILFGTFFELTASILAAIAKPIPDHTVATPAAKGLD